MPIPTTPANLSSDIAPRHSTEQAPPLTAGELAEKYGLSTDNLMSFANALQALSLDAYGDFSPDALNAPESRVSGVEALVALRAMASAARRVCAQNAEAFEFAAELAVIDFCGADKAPELYRAVSALATVMERESPIIPDKVAGAAKL